MRMSATAYLYPVLLLSCVMHHICAISRANYPLSFDFTTDTSSPNLIVDKNLVFKRDTPSLSIVNPLDVLRKRLLLEMARRQMKENTRQVERNRAILKTVGKRINQQVASTFESMMMPMVEDLLPYTQHKLLYNQLHMYPIVHSKPDRVKYPSTDITTNLFHANNRRRNNEQTMHGERNDDKVIEEGRQMSMNNFIAYDDNRNYNDHYSDGVLIAGTVPDRQSANGYEYTTTLLRHKRWPDNIQLQIMKNQAVNEQQQGEQHQEQQQQLKAVYNESNSMWRNPLALSLNLIDPTPVDTSFISDNPKTSTEGMTNFIHSTDQQPRQLQMQQQQEQEQQQQQQQQKQQHHLY